MAEEWILSDAHAHIGSLEERQEREEKGILSLLCAVNPKEARTLWEIFEKSASKGCLIPCCGIHPWYSDRFSLEEMEPWMKRCPVIGEIGMDSVWCEVPLTIQEERLRQQLLLASQWKKPVVLHTKGQEKEIAQVIKEYPNRYLVHWYSCDSFLEEYIKLDCYFSVGPDVWWNETVQNVARQVPEDRLTLETDGLSAVKWAYEEGKNHGEAEGREEFRQGEKEGFSDGHEAKGGVAYSLKHTLEIVAGIRGISPEKAGWQFRENLKSFAEGRNKKYPSTNSLTEDIIDR